MNKFVSWLTMDCLVTSAVAWSTSHIINHHKTVNQWPPDDQILFGSSMIEEYFWTLVLLMKYQIQDILYVFGLKKYQKNDLWNKLRVAMGLAARFSILSYPVFKRKYGWKILAANTVSVITVANYFVLVAHNLPVTSKPKTDNYGILQMRETWDIMPQSKLAMCMQLGFGCHATHHIFGFYPRQLLPLISSQLEILCPDEYRQIDNVWDHIKFLWNRHQTM